MTLSGTSDQPMVQCGGCCKAGCVSGGWSSAVVEAAEDGCTPGPVVHQSHCRGRGGSTLHRYTALRGWLCSPALHPEL